MNGLVIFSSFLNLFIVRCNQPLQWIYFYLKVLSVIMIVDCFRSFKYPKTFCNPIEARLIFSKNSTHSVSFEFLNKIFLVLYFKFILENLKDISLSELNHQN